ncbi:MAG: response regulator [Scytonema sp. PMC 1070.18]|nr:response regulator [Scytonema sp. PMC 1070.18]
MFNQTLQLKNLQVLVVDSNRDSRDLLRMMFEEYDVETICTTSAFEALEILPKIKPDLLISEILLPDEDGYSLISKVRKFEIVRRVRIPAIALTVCAREDDRVRALSAGFCYHLPKPFDIDELIAIAAQLMKHVQLMPSI